MPKRGNGEGSVYRRKDGKWVAAITSSTGKKMYHYGKTRKECVEWLERAKQSLKKGEHPEHSKMTVLEFLQDWSGDYCIDIRPSTRMNYDTYINRHIGISKIADTPLCKLDTQALQEFFNELSRNGRIDGKGGLSPKTIRNLYNMLHKALKQAVGNRIIAYNPIEYVVLPKVRKKTVRTLDFKEQDSLLKACGDDKWAIGIKLSLMTGLRIGELLALRQSDVKTTDGICYLDISKSLQRVKDYNGETDGHSTVLHESETKTDNSCRKIPLPPNLAAVLSRHISNQKETAKTTYGLYNQDPYIISNEIGDFVDPTTYRTWFNKITEKAGISGRVTPHTLRHSFASTALKCGMNLKNISDILGHYSTDFTARTYIHTDLDGKYEAMNAMLDKLEERKADKDADSEDKLLS